MGGTAALSALIILLALLSPAGAIAGEAVITFLDVGEGEAVLVETPGGKKVLVDTGNLVTGRSVAQALRRRSIDSLDAVFITHHHPDHMGGVFHLAPFIEEALRFDNGVELKAPGCEGDMYRYFADLFRTGRYRVPADGEEISFDEVTFHVMRYGGEKRDWNTNSLVIMVRHGGVRILLMGDGGLETERYLIEKGVDLRAQLLKVGHHGAADASSEAFIKAVSPRYAVISIDSGNRRGYPSKEVVERLRRAGARVLITAERGDITLRSDGSALKKESKGNSD